MKAPCPRESSGGTVEFDPDSTSAFQRRMERAPDWFCSFLAGNTREKNRLRSELAVMRSASSVSPYLIIWVVPGSMLILPFLAWFIDHKRKTRREPEQG